MRDKNLTAIYYVLVGLATVFVAHYSTNVVDVGRQYCFVHGTRLYLHAPAPAHLSFTLSHK